MLVPPDVHKLLDLSRNGTAVLLESRLRGAWSRQVVGMGVRGPGAISVLKAQEEELACSQAERPEAIGSEHRWGAGCWEDCFHGESCKRRGRRA